MNYTANPMRRVVVTGLGLVTPLAVGTSASWTGLLNGACGIRKLEQPEYSKLPCRIAAAVPNLQLESAAKLCGISASNMRQMSRGVVFALIAAEEAVCDAKLPFDSKEDEENCGVAVGMGISDLDDIHRTGSFLDQGKYSKISPYFVPRILTNMAAGQISIKYSLMGPNHSVATACTTGAHSIGDAFNFIRLGHCERMICGGTEACISPICLAGFARCRALSTAYNDQPIKSSRPFDRKRDGFVVGEGAGILVLETLESAQKRKADKIYAEVMGYGLSGDGFHLTAPHESGDGAELCMKRAMSCCGVDPNLVGYVNAHATSTPLGDELESLAISRIFLNNKPFVSSTKGAVGHLLGAAGAVEAIFAILSCYTGQIPPNLNLDKTDIKLGLNYAKSDEITSWKQEVRRCALSNSFGFGGTNATLCVSEFVN